MSKLTFTVDNPPKSGKIGDYLRQRLGFSSSLVAKVKFGGVSLGGEIVHMRAQVKNGDIITVDMPNESSENIPPIDVPIEVIYEDEHILVVNKPVNMPTHPSKGNSLPTLANAVANYLLPQKIVFRSITRLDRDTSGLVLIAKNGYSAAVLSRQMKSGKIIKKYTALVTGTPKEKVGIVDAPIERECEGSIKRIVRSDGKRAITEYKVIKTCASGNSILEVNLLTGRTHQIRVHMAYIGHALFNDFLYGEKVTEGTYRLHCSYLEFVHPIKNQILSIKSEAEFAK